MMAGWPVVMGGLVAAMLGILCSIELDDVDVLLVERAVALSKSRARAFSFISNLANYAEVLYTIKGHCSLLRLVS